MARTMLNQSGRPVGNCTGRRVFFALSHPDGNRDGMEHIDGRRLSNGLLVQWGAEHLLLWIIRPILYPGNQINLRFSGFG